MTCLHKSDFEPNKPHLVRHDDQWESAVAVTICLVLGLVIIIIAVATSGIK